MSSRYSGTNCSSTNAYLWGWGRRARYVHSCAHVRTMLSSSIRFALITGKRLLGWVKKTLTIRRGLEFKTRCLPIHNKQKLTVIKKRLSCPSEEQQGFISQTALIAFQHSELLWWADPGWMPGTHQAALSLLSSAGQGKGNRTKGSWAGIRPGRSPGNYYHGQNRFSLGKSASFITNQIKAG